MTYAQLLGWINDPTRDQPQLSACAVGLGLNGVGTVPQLRMRIRAHIAAKPDLTMAAPWAPPAATTATATRTTTTTRTRTNNNALLGLVSVVALLLLACMVCIAGSALLNMAQGRGPSLFPIMGISLSQKPVVALQQPAAAKTFGDYEVMTQNTPNGMFTVGQNEVAAVWWKVTLDGEYLGDCAGAWLSPGSYTIQSPGRIRVWERVPDGQMASFHSWWESAVQAEADSAQVIYTNRGCVLQLQSPVDLFFIFYPVCLFLRVLDTFFFIDLMVKKTKKN